MKKEIDHIDLVLENVDTIHIPYKHIEYLSIEGISTKIYVSGTYYSEDYVCDKISLLIKKEGNIKHAPFGAMEEECYIFDYILKFRDLCWIDIIYKDSTNKYIATPWGTSDYINDYMEAEINKDGNLEIHIEENK